MFDHVALSVPRDIYPEVVEFYLAALTPLGYEKQISMLDGRLVALGDTQSTMSNKADFWLSGMSDYHAETHWAFVAQGKQKRHLYYRIKVDLDFLSPKKKIKWMPSIGKLWKLVVQDNGPPGPRPRFGPEYYAAFVIDPVGNNVEVVCRKSD
jgi:hypothetical protein